MNTFDLKEFGEVIKDPYPDLHDDGEGNADANLWLDLFAKAKEVDFELFSILWYLRGTGCRLVPSSTIGYRIVPMIKDTSWISQSQYNKEKKYLDPYKSILVELLKGLNVTSAPIDDYEDIPL